MTRASHVKLFGPLGEEDPWLLSVRGIEVASTVGRPRSRGRGAADGAEGPAYTAALGHRGLSTTHVGGFAPANSTSEGGG
jgi:hypothetical protein